MKNMTRSIPVLCAAVIAVVSLAQILPAGETPLSADTHGRVASLAPGQGEIRVLVVDDIFTDRELLLGMLEPLGFIVDEAIDGNEAIEKVNSSKPRIVLMDQVMPGMDAGGNQMSFDIFVLNRRLYESPTG